MTLLSCITALTLGAVMIYPPLKLLNDVMLKHLEIEQDILLAQNINRAMELLARAIREAGYRISQNSINENDIQIKQDGLFKGSAAIELMQDLPRHLAYDCMGNVLSKERTRQQKTYQHFYLERSRNDPQSASLICQSLDRKGHLHQAELLNPQAINATMLSPKGPTGLIKISLGVMRTSKTTKVNKLIEQVRWVAPRHI
jgi:type II secretory pathway component PulJ